MFICEVSLELDKVSLELDKVSHILAKPRRLKCKERGPYKKKKWSLPIDFDEIDLEAYQAKIDSLRLEDVSSDEGEWSNGSDLVQDGISNFSDDLLNSDVEY